MSGRKFIYASTSLLFILWVFFSSCNSLKPVVQTGSLQELNPHDIVRFDGDYDVLSPDTSYPTLAYALTFTRKMHLQDPRYKGKPIDPNMKVRIKSIDDTRLRVSVLAGEKLIKRKTIRGKISANYFQFTMRKVFFVKPFYGILNLGKKQQNRIGLLKNGDLVMDSYEGGILFLVIMPTFGGDGDRYGQVFRRR